MRYIKGKFCIIIIMLSFSCSFNDQDLKESWWKYSDGYHIGDVLNFNKSHSISKDTVYFDQVPMAVVLSKKDRVFGFTSRKIIIKSLDSDESGVYLQK